ncbi:uncharacterized protein LOC131956090 isoform X2 [Physella acuta]|uniref:uncharacterized protein LOC131956090 isoform X2 n=1 Tax=Physella acuta TaxID=109671 RepID=UPI0027DDAA64|nr:uncharacterized protein LOC131956090 isoform X2 [Physella acuta]
MAATASRCLSVCLCLEDPLANLLLVSQVANGSVFGRHQPLSLTLHADGTDDLDELEMEIQDCSFPLVQGVSKHRDLQEMPEAPQLIVVILNRREYKPWGSSDGQFQTLVSLVIYMHNMGNMLDGRNLSNTQILVVGDLALTAATILASKLSQLSARQLIALDGDSEKPVSLPHKSEHHGRVDRITAAIKAWWTGLKTSPLRMGTKFFSAENFKLGYFLSSPVKMEAPRMFSVSSPGHVTSPHMSEVMATTDTAQQIFNQLEGSVNGAQPSTLAKL